MTKDELCDWLGTKQLGLFEYRGKLRLRSRGDSFPISDQELRQLMIMWMKEYKALK